MLNMESFLEVLQFFLFANSLKMVQFLEKSLQMEHILEKKKSVKWSAFLKMP